MSAELLKPTLSKILTKLDNEFMFIETTYLTASVTKSVKDELKKKNAIVRGYDTCMIDGKLEINKFCETLNPLYSEFENGKFRYYDIKWCFVNDKPNRQVVLILDPFNLRTLYPFNNKNASYLQSIADKVILVYNTSERRKPGCAERHANLLLGKANCIEKIDYNQRFCVQGTCRTWSVWVNNAFKI